MVGSELLVGPADDDVAGAPAAGVPVVDWLHPARPTIATTLSASPLGSTVAISLGRTTDAPPIDPHRCNE
ncbi:MAG TPA: hypothetical protein PKY70_07410 [Nakamurella multipartita]|nr:hypothetical protein [Nakamurella multipartita]